MSVFCLSICNSRIAYNQMIKPQDIFVGLDLCRGEQGRGTYAERGERLSMSASEVHAAVGRLGQARLLDPESKSVRRKSFMEFLEHGVPYVFAVHTGEVTRGIPTAWAAPVLANQIVQGGSLPPVWADPNGKTEGVSLRPLYRSVPKASRANPDLYDLLALVDALRIGRVREREIAKTMLNKKLKDYATA